MSRLRVACSALNRTIYAGHLNRAGTAFKTRHDVTSDVLRAIIDKIGMNHQTVVTQGNNNVCVIKVYELENDEIEPSEKIVRAIWTNMFPSHDPNEWDQCNAWNWIKHEGPGAGDFYKAFIAAKTCLNYSTPVED